MAKSKVLLRRGALAAICVTGLALPSVAMAGTVTLVATLTGANETSGGDPDGTASFSVEIDPDAGDVCYVLTAKNIDAPTMAHIHAGAAGVDGGVVVKLDVDGLKNDLCVAAEPDALKPIVASPGDYYVNVHTAAFPKGAIRGQLQKK